MDRSPVYFSFYNEYNYSRHPEPLFLCSHNTVWRFFRKGGSLCFLLWSPVTGGKSKGRIPKHPSSTFLQVTSPLHLLSIVLKLIFKSLMYFATALFFPPTMNLERENDPDYSGISPSHYHYRSGNQLLQGRGLGSVIEHLLCIQMGPRFNNWHLPLKGTGGRQCERPPPEIWETAAASQRSPHQSWQINILPHEASFT